MFDHGEISGFLDEGTSFVGELTFRNTMRIDGTFKGKIRSKNVLIIGETATIDGEIEVSNVSINGKVNGHITADKKIEIHSKGQVFCDIVTPKLVIEDGAFFQGNCNMNGTVTLIESGAPVDDDDLPAEVREALHQDRGGNPQKKKD
jgi:cytoskeletal protein CcmA (bactofilin family)